ncbi:MAG: carboxypeptidase regulatory-like domain-containing protein, partial [Bacteroidales bacterium]|nr:carboxypeptidase regulatory-like domain-containing protein [Bacteroidales bacterium]
MMYSFKRIFLVMAAAFAGIVSYAQVTTSSLGGRVVDENGEPVPGAAIVATHTPSGTVYGVITNLDGRYTIQGMRTGGPYTVEVSSLGYQTVSNTDVTLQLGELYNLDATLRTSTEQLNEVVVVASPTSKFAAVQKTGATTNISNKEMMVLPSAYRDIQDMAKLSPYAGSGMSLAGSDGRMTNFTVDGANFNNNFGLNDNLPGGGNPISIDAIEEMQVAVSPFDVRQSNFIGGGINAITKSGTNT